jgi:flagellar hook-associated protein 1 FlgK
MAAVGGSLAGMARFADDDIAASRARLGQIVAGVAQAFNDQQAGGLDATGAPGSPFFTVGTPTASAAAGNGGSAQLSVSIANGSTIKASDYALAWDGSNYQLTRLADGNVSSFAALPQSVDGLTISLGSGTPAQGDRFLLRTASTLIPGLAAVTFDPAKIATASASTTADWASDNRNAKALLALGDALSVDGTSVISRYASLIGEVGTRSQSAQAASDMSVRLADDAARSRSELSDVNLDEEAAHLLQFQQAYAASAKVIAAANEMFRTLLGALG